MSKKLLEIGSNDDRDGGAAMFDNVSPVLAGIVAVGVAISLCRRK